MVKFLKAAHIRDIVGEIGLRQFWLALIDRLREEFARWQSFEKSPRFASYSKNGVIELMPISDGELFCFKFVNGHPANAALRLQTVIAFGALADVATGYPLLLAEMTLATAFRTAATSALAAQYLARSDSTTMALIGLGAQSEFQASAFGAALGLSQLRIYDIDDAAAAKFEQNMAESGLKIVRCRSVEEATLGADVITTITANKKRATVLFDQMVRAGVHINAVGGDCPGKTELARELLLRSDIFVEYEPQARIEGEIQQLRADHPVIELWEVVAGRRKGRVTPQAVTLFDSVGFAIEDFSILRLLWELSNEMGVGDEIELVAPPEDPKDLFSLLRAPRSEQIRQCA